MKTRVLELNASDERGISVVRNKARARRGAARRRTRARPSDRVAVRRCLTLPPHPPPPARAQVKSFAAAAVGQPAAGYPCPPYKLLILDEADSMTQACAGGLCAAACARRFVRGAPPPLPPAFRARCPALGAAGPRARARPRAPPQRRAAALYGPRPSRAVPPTGRAERAAAHDGAVQQGARGGGRVVGGGQGGSSTARRAGGRGARAWPAAPLPPSILPGSGPAPRPPRPRVRPPQAPASAARPIPRPRTPPTPPPRKGHALLLHLQLREPHHRAAGQPLRQVPVQAAAHGRHAGAGPRARGVWREEGAEAAGAAARRGAPGARARGRRGGLA